MQQAFAPRSTLREHLESEWKQRAAADSMESPCTLVQSSGVTEFMTELGTI
jgi:hypothetical protein